MSNSLDNRTGQVLQFVYLKGSSPGSVRTVYVLGYAGHNNAIQAYCFDRQCIRNFTRAYIRQPIEVDVRRVSTDLLPSNLDEVINGYVQDGYDVFHDEEHDMVVSFKRPSYTHSVGTGVLLLRGPSGGVKLDLSHGLVELTTYDAHNNPSGTNTKPSTVDIIEAFEAVG